VLFLERDQEWYASNRDLPKPPYGNTAIYSDVRALHREYESEIESADLVIVGSYVPEGIAVGSWVTSTARGVTAFYHIDTPVSLANLQNGTCDYLNVALVPRFDLYLSFTGGPTLHFIEKELGSPSARPLYCSVDPSLYYPAPVERCWDLGYLGTYSSDRQPALESLLLQAARNWSAGRFAVAGPMYPDSIGWPENVERIIHLAPGEHRAFYNRQRFTLNITRREKVRAGYSPSVRLFEAAACGTPIISDYWNGLESLLEPETEILIARSEEDTLRYLRNVSEEQRLAIAARARSKVLRSHTGAHRAAELETYVFEIRRKSLTQ
jgi:spore maturation protein CgeB